MEEKSYKTFAYPVKTVKSSKYIPARANNSFDSSLQKRHERSEIADVLGCL